MEALSQSLGQEVAPLGIKALIAEPSGFRTDWAGRSADEAHHAIAAYRDTAGARASGIRAASGKQPGDPVRAAAAIVETVETPGAPLRLLLGRQAIETARVKIRDLAANFDAVADIAIAADFPTGQ